MSLFLSDKITEKGGEVRLNFKVSKVVQNVEKVVVSNLEGDTIKGNYLIMAIPPTQLPKIEFSPPLSP